MKFVHIELWAYGRTLLVGPWEGYLNNQPLGKEVFEAGGMIYSKAKNRKEPGVAGVSI
jgi:hypothetical protein